MWKNALLSLVALSTIGCITEEPSVDVPAFVDTQLSETNECLDGTHDCGDHATCYDRSRGFVCLCDPGFDGDGTTCRNIDECLRADACGPGATCVDRDGGYDCGCPYGWVSDGGRGCRPDCARVYADGHGDIFITQEASGFSLAVRSALDAFDDREYLYPPEDVCIMVGRPAFELSLSLGGRPEGEQWDSLGIGPGEGFWLLPEVAEAGMPWFGMSAEAVSSGLFVDEVLTLELAVERMPEGAAVSSFYTDDLGELRYLYSTLDDVWDAPVHVSAHAHMNWVFSKPGDYYLRFAARGRTIGGVEVTGPARVYRFIIQ